MKTLFVALVILGALVWSSPARAAEEPSPRLVGTTACVRADFPVTGSGWKVQRMVEVWNSVQSTVRLEMGDSSCDDILIHRYSSTTDGACGWTKWDQRQILTVVNGEVESRGADVYLNDVCLTYDNDQRKAIIAHELGHAMGLSHNQSSRSVMGSARPWKTHGVPGPIDVRNLSSRYQ